MPLPIKAKVAEAFLELSQRKSVDKITVKDLVEACGISRQTFYYHFQDILDVIEWSAQQFFQEVLKRSLEASSPEAALEVFVSAAVRGRPLLQKLLESQRRMQVENILVQAARSYLKELLRGQDLQVSYADGEAALSFCAYGLVGLLLENCEKKDLNQSLLARQMYSLLARQLKTPDLEF